MEFFLKKIVCVIRVQNTEEFEESIWTHEVPTQTNICKKG